MRKSDGRLRRRAACGGSSLGSKHSTRHLNNVRREAGTEKLIHSSTAKLHPAAKTDRSSRTAAAGRRTAGRVLAPPAASDRLAARLCLAELSSKQRAGFRSPTQTAPLSAGAAPACVTEVSAAAARQAAGPCKRPQRAAALARRRGQRVELLTCRGRRRQDAELGAAAAARSWGWPGKYVSYFCCLLTPNLDGDNNRPAAAAAPNQTFALRFHRLLTVLAPLPSMAGQAAAGHTCPAGLAAAAAAANRASCPARARSLVSAKVWPQWLLCGQMQPARKTGAATQLADAARNTQVAAAIAPAFQVNRWNLRGCTSGLRLPGPWLAAVQSQPHYWLTGCPMIGSNT